jgi:HPt (histidine-containing phosphotransfer) domain-containing protein
MNDVHTIWHFDRTAALGRLDDDEGLLMEVMAQFVADAPAALAAIEAAIREGDGPALGDAAHALKGAAGYLAADDLCVAAQELEGFGRSGQTEAARDAWPRFSALANSMLSTLRATPPVA